jgi:hypothetical protein
MDFGIATEMKSSWLLKDSLANCGGAWPILNVGFFLGPDAWQWWNRLRIRVRVRVRVRVLVCFKHQSEKDGGGDLKVCRGELNSEGG